MTFQITRTGITFPNKAIALKRLREEFDHKHYVRLPQMLDVSLLEHLQTGLAQGSFRPIVYEDVHMSERLMLKNPAVALLLFLANDRSLLTVIQEIAGCARLGSFMGRVYTLKPGEGLEESWHSDFREGRLIGMTVNLSPEPFQGGILQIRERDSKKIISEVANTGFGDGVIFRIGESLEHQNTVLEGAVPKLAFAGWFRQKPEFFPAFKEMISGSKASVQERRLPQGTAHTPPAALRDCVKMGREVIYRRFDEEAVLLNTETNSFYLLNGMGDRIWGLLTEHGRLEKVLEIARGQYDVDPKILQEDILDQVRDLQAAGLLEVIT